MDNVIYSPSGNISIRINEDKMSAWMYIHKSNAVLDEKEILDLIGDAGICYGLEDAIEWMSENGYTKDFEKPFPIALCKPALSKDKINLHFDRNKTFNPEKEWKLTDLQNWIIVEQGSSLAEVSYNLFSSGGSVYNIFGELSPDAISTLFLSDYLGKNVSLDVENKRILASVEGYPYIDKDNRINVADHLVFRGDIKQVDLPIPLAASLTVEGSILRSHLSVLKDLIVKGNIVAAELSSTGFLTVEGDVKDCRLPGVTALKDLKVRGVDNSLILCNGKMDFGASITNSRVIAEKGISGNSDVSLIVGSQILSGGCIDIADAGDEKSTFTELEITYLPFIKERILLVGKLLKQFPAQSDSSSGRRDYLLKVMHQLESDLESAMNEATESEADQDLYIKIRNTLYKDVYLRVLKTSLTNKRLQSNLEFRQY